MTQKQMREYTTKDKPPHYGLHPPYAAAVLGCGIAGVEQSEVLRDKEIIEEKLLSFYRDNRFSQFDTRQTISDTDESHELIQLLRLLCGNRCNGGVLHAVHCHVPFPVWSGENGGGGQSLLGIRKAEDVGEWGGVSEQESRGGLSEGR